MIIRVNKNKQFVAEMRQAIKDNEGYCPCVITRSPDTKCMCKEFREMIDNGETGMCHCGLYIIEEDN